MRYPKDYVLPYGTPFTICLRVMRNPHRISKYLLRARLADPHGHTYNAHIINGNNAQTTRGGFWTLSEHVNYGRAAAKAIWITKAPMGELIEARNIVYGIEKVDTLWDNWNASMVRFVDLPG